MPVSVIPSAKQAASKRLKSATSRKRRQNQNVEIDELASLVPLAQTSLVPSDKLSVLRLATTFLKLQSFMKETSLVNGSGNGGEHVSTNDFAELMKEAIDGFLIVLDKDANILYVSETITDCVGLSQQDVIGQNLIDIAQPESATEIADCLKPSIVPSLARSSAVEESMVSQFRQFYVKFRPPSKSTTFPVVQVSGNLKVKLPPLRSTAKVSTVEPVVMGFTGECRVIESISSIIEISVSHSTFTMLKDTDKKMTYIEASIKEIIGYEPEEFYANHERFYDFLHPAEYSDLKAMAAKSKDHTGHAVSPYFRFLTKSGDWVWMQMESITHYKSGTTIPQYYEYKVRVLSQGKNKMKCIEHKAQTDNEKQSPQPDHHQSDSTSSLINTSIISTPSVPSSTASSNELFPTSQSSVPHGSPSMYSSTGSISSLSTTCPPSASSVPTSSPSHSPLHQPQSSNPSPNSLSSVLHVDSSPSTSPAGISFSGVPDVPQTTRSWISSQTQWQQQPAPIDITEVPVEGAVLYSPEIQNEAQSPQSIQNLQSDGQRPPSVQNGVQSPPSVSELKLSTLSADSGVLLPAQRNFSNGGSLSPDSCSPYNSPFSTVSTLPSSVWSPEMATSLHTAVSTDSIPSTASSVPFQNSPQTSDFIPQAPPISDSFNPQIPSNFNFSSNAASYSQNFDNSDFVPGLDFSMLEPQLFNTSSSPQIHSGDSMLQHLLGEILALNDGSDFSAAAHTIPGNGTVNMDSTFIPHSNAVPTSNSNTSAPFQGSSPAEVQDILQKFM